jgi:ABC-type sugar transport system permease subunit
MRVFHLFIRLTLYYSAVSAIVYTAVTLQPGLQEFLPIGGAESLLSGPSNDPFESIEIGATQISNFGESLVWLLIAVIGALLTVLPVSWTYVAIRSRDEYDQSLVETIIILPIAVTSIVIIVHNSLALAFSLAGIVGGVRFRNTLKSSGDALYILLAIGIGLSAGIGAMEIAIVMSMTFNYCFLILWMTDYGAKKGVHRYMRRNQKKRPLEEQPEAVAPE